MMKRFALTVLCGLMIGHGAQAQKQDATAGGKVSALRPAGPVSFKRDIIPIFRTSCTMCHQGDIPMGGLALTPDVAHESLVGAQSAGAPMLRVKAGKPEQSYLYFKTSGQNGRIKGQGYGMPWGQALRPADLDLLRRWIRQGAKND